MFKRCLSAIVATCIAGLMHTPIACNTYDLTPEKETESSSRIVIVDAIDSIEIVPLPVVESKYSEEDIAMIEAVVMHEVGYCSKESKIAVTHLILNRVESELFPDTVYEVLHQKGQFGAIHNYYDNELPVDEETSKTVRAAIESGSSHEAVFYYAPKYTNDKKTAAWFESLDFQFEIDGQRYFK